jgi:thioesterase domain-containing protein/acyl carrier protein
MEPTLQERLAALSPQQRAELLTRLRAKQERQDAREDVIRPRPGGGTPELSHAQQRLRFLDQLMEHRAVYHTPIVLRLRGPLDTAALGQALTMLVTRHTVLRTRLPQNTQVIDPAPASVLLQMQDLSHLDAAEQELLAGEHIAWGAREAFDLAAMPPLRARLLRFADADHMFALFLHHIVMDDWSVPLLINELVQGYLAVTAGISPKLPDLPVQYADYAVWQRCRLDGPVGQQQAAYWARQLDGSEATRLPADRPRPRKPAWAGETITVRLPPGLVAQPGTALHQMLLVILATGLNALLARWAGTTDIVIGTVFSGRVRRELEPLIGFFSNTVVLRTDASGDPTLATLLERTAETVMSAHSNQELPFDRVVAQQRPRRSGASNPLFQVALVTAGTPTQTFTLNGLSVEPLDVELGTSRFDLALAAGRLADGAVVVSAEYSTELFDRSRIECLLGDLRSVLEALASAPGTRLSALRLAGPIPGVVLSDEEDTPPQEHSGQACSWSPAGQVVAGLWATTLCVPQTRPEDDFFELGGGSIQAVSLIMEVRERLGVEVRLSDFFTRPTLAAMVALVEAALLEDVPGRPGSLAGELVVPLRTGDPARSPLFLIHTSGGSTMSYAALCRELPAGIACYGVEALGLGGGEIPQSVGQMAGAYAAAIRAAQPEGPYRLAGWSIGGGLAHATAAQLRRQGAEVSLLALLDTQEPPVLPQAPSAPALRAFFAEVFALTEGHPPCGPSEADLADLDDAAQTEHVIGTLVKSGLVPPEAAELLRERIEIFNAILSSAAVWRPDHYDGRVDLFLTATSPKSAPAGWAKWTGGPVVTHSVPGDHYSMIRPPCVTELGRALSAVLEGSVNAAG